MRTTDVLFELEEILILWQYLYMSENHFITIDNGITKLEIRMRENCSFHAKNLSFPDLPDLEYTDMMTIPNMLGIIDQLKMCLLQNLRSILNQDGTKFAISLQETLHRIK